MEEVDGYLWKLRVEVIVIWVVGLIWFDFMGRVGFLLRIFLVFSFGSDRCFSSFKYCGGSIRKCAVFLV